MRYSSNLFDVDDELEKELHRLRRELERKKSQISRRKEEKESRLSSVKDSYRDSISEIEERRDQLESLRTGLEKTGYQSDSEVRRLELIDDLLDGLEEDRRGKRFRRDELVTGLEEEHRRNVEGLEDEVAELRREIDELESSMELLDDL